MGRRHEPLQRKPDFWRPVSFGGGHFDAVLVRFIYARVYYDILYYTTVTDCDMEFGGSWFTWGSGFRV